LFDRNLRLLVTYNPAGLPRAASRRLAETLGRLQQLSLAKLIVLGAPPFDLPRLKQFAEKRPFFVTEVASLARSRLPRGPELVLIGPDQRLEAQNLAPRPESPRIFVTPEDQPAPDGRRLRDVFGGRALTLEEFHARVGQ